MELQTLIGRCPEGQEFVRGYRKISGEYVRNFVARDMSISHYMIEKLT